MLSKGQRQLKRQIFNSLFSVYKRTFIRRRTSMPQLITATVTEQEFKDLFGFDEPSGLYQDSKFRLVLNKFGRCYWLLSIDNLQGPRFSGVNVYYQGNNSRLIRTIYPNARRIIDVGANVGQYAEIMRSIGFKGDIFSFEPIKTVFSILERKSKNDKKWHVFPYAIGNSDEKLEINISKNLVSSSINKSLDQLTQSEPSAVFVDKEEIIVHKLDSIFNSLNITEKNIFLKIDTQGYEKEVLLGASDSLKYVKGIQIEMALVPTYENVIMFDDMKSKIEQIGFKLMAIERGFFDVKTGRQLEVDGIFYRI